jgi:uncharacterized protein YndB with AHSA1/START domain
MSSKPTPGDALTDTGTRRFSMSIDIDATPEEVWRALTDAGELVRWFPTQARVTPGPGGTMFWGWDGHWAWESTIDAWEPGSRLRLTEERPAFDASGAPLAGPTQRMAMEFTLESHAGKTRLRLVHSGFGDGETWDDELESVSAGWQFELRGLRHYLERHQGCDRFPAIINTTTARPIDEVWQRLLSVFGVQGGTLEIGGRAVLSSARGDRLSGVVAWHNPGHDLFVIVDELDGGIFRICTWRAGGKTGAQIWWAAYSAAHADALRTLAERTRPIVEAAIA